ncbi:MAG: hypothetical protein HC794_05495, partial [Nitrospiraceae bacterium]|nr:hypothetical protein [Nitrospiraceae bacterium]
SLMKSHLGLYQGYVKNTNQLAALLLNMVKLGKANTMEYAEMKRRFGWEFNGMRLHELYFENLSRRPVPIRKNVPRSMKNSGRILVSSGTWERGFMGVGGMRGIGWVVLTCDPVSGRLFNIWLDEHDDGFPVGSSPLLVMDVFEHAYIHDYGMDRRPMSQAFMKAIDWRVVERRFESSTFHPGLTMAVNKRRAG